jgi:hypothetical protein
VGNLNPKIYKLNELSEDYFACCDKDQVGLIADEVELVMPECVGTQKHKALKEVKTLDITNVTYALVNAVKELTARIKVLEELVNPTTDEPDPKRVAL